MGSGNRYAGAKMINDNIIMGFSTKLKWVFKFNTGNKKLLLENLRPSI